MPPEFYGVDNSLLETLFINNYILVDLIKETNHPEANNVKLVFKSTRGNG